MNNEHLLGGGDGKGKPTLHKKLVSTVIMPIKWIQTTMQKHYLNLTVT